MQERRLVPTELGFAVTKILVDHFKNLFDVSFTATMEEELDDIEEGKIGWTAFKYIMRDPRFDEIPLILETVDHTLWPEEIARLYAFSAKG